MFIHNRRSASSRAAISGALVLFLVLGDSLAFAQRRGGGGGMRGGGGGRSYSGSGSRGSVSSANRGSATTSRSTYGNTSSRTTNYETRSGNTGTATRDVTRSGDEINVNRNVQSSSGASRTSDRTYNMDDGRVDSVERNSSVTGRSGQTASWEGKAERSGAGWEFEGEGHNRYGQKVEAEGYGARGPYGSGVVADVEGGRYGDRTVVAGRGYGGPVYARHLPAGYRPYN